MPEAQALFTLLALSTAEVLALDIFSLASIFVSILSESFLDYVVM